MNFKFDFLFIYVLYSLQVTQYSSPDYCRRDISEDAQSTAQVTNEILTTVEDVKFKVSISAIWMAFILKARYNTSDAWLIWYSISDDHTHVRTNKKSTRKKQERFGTSHYKKEVCTPDPHQLQQTNGAAVGYHNESWRIWNDDWNKSVVDNLTVDIDQQMTALLCVVVCNTVKEIRHWRSFLNLFSIL